MSDRTGRMNADFWRLVDALTVQCQDLAIKRLQRRANPAASRIREIVVELHSLCTLSDSVIQELERLAPKSEDATIGQAKITEEANEIATSLCYMWFSVMTTVSLGEIPQSEIVPLIPTITETTHALCKMCGTTRIEAERLIRAAFNGIVPVGEALRLPSLTASKQIVVERIGENSYKVYEIEAG